MQNPFQFEDSFKAWQQIPIDDFGYYSPLEILSLEMEQQRELINFAQALRWNPQGWRNKDNKLSDFLLHDVKDKFVMDFGCGAGLDAIQLRYNGAKILLADIHASTVYFAQQMMSLMQGAIAHRLVFVQATWPFFCSEPLDIFWSSGVLHHTPMIGEILQRACGLLKPEGECRITLYSDRRWQLLMGEPAPSIPTWEHPRFKEYVKHCDAVGEYADWYNQEKLQSIIEPFGVISACEYISNDHLIAATIKPKLVVDPKT